MYDLQTHEIFISRDVVFYEEIFPCKSNAKENVSEHQGSLSSGTVYDDAKIICELGHKINQEDAMAQSSDRGSSEGNQSLHEEQPVEPMGLGAPTVAVLDEQ